MCSRGFEPAVDCFERKRTARTISGNPMIPAASAAPVHRNANHGHRTILPAGRRSARACEEKQEKISDDYRRQHQRQVHHCVEQRLAGKSCAREQVRYGDRERQTGEHAPE